AKETIRSPITIENKQKTEQKTRETVQAVDDRYNISKEITDERVGYITEIFDAVHTVDDEKDNKTSEQGEDKSVVLTVQEKVQRLQNMLSQEIVDSVDGLVLTQLLKANEEERHTGKGILIDNLTTVLNNGVRTENLHNVTNDVKQEIKYTKLTADMKQALMSLADFA